jgi:MoaA/NifB/PqqE/SkfB family radical SAM enzyme
MCGQWNRNGYVANKVGRSEVSMDLKIWKRLVDEASDYEIQMILVRGGEPFLFPAIIDLLEYINKKNIFISIDTNGSIINKFARKLVEMGNLHITFSVDGPENIHDKVRGKNGCFQKLQKNITLFKKLENELGNTISKSICFTISKYSYLGLSQMPEVARSLGIKSVNIIPCYYFSKETGEKYEQEIYKLSGNPTFSWKGFEQDDSGIDIEIFTKQLRKYKADPGSIENYPFLPLSEAEYKMWFSDSTTPVGSPLCMNIEKLIDIQPGGEANFCVDFPDYNIGNVRNATIKALWNSAEAEKFRHYRRNKPFSICYRCGAKYISEII